MLVAVLIFVTALAMIAVERVHRTKVALVGAALVVLTQTIDQEQAIAAIDFNTIGLLAGMMLIVRVTEPTGVYNYLAIRAGQLSRGRPLALVVALAATAALISAFLDNVTTLLLLVPITLLLADTLDIDWLPLVLIEVFSANIGGAATLIGDPPNIMIAGATGLGFVEFIANLAPIVVVVLISVTAVIYAWFRSRLQIAESERRNILSLEARKSIEDWQELKRTVPVLVLTLVAFFVHKPLHLEPATVALSGAALMLLVTKQSVEKALAGIEWPVIFFFLGLFVMVGALEEVGALERVADAFISVTDGQRALELVGVVWAGAIGSAAVDNIPFTASMIPIVEQLQEAGGGNGLWWALALGTAFGGNATLIAAAPNITAAAMVQRAGKRLTFLDFVRVGVPVAVLSTALACGYLLIRYAW